ncbi:MAG: hypothetical protein ABSB61_09695 [Anaerolineales bacterium]|jgi:hypothetical protein
MKDSLKIALGIVLGVVALAACGFCAFLAVTAGGVSLFTSAVPTILAPTPTAAPLAEGQQLSVGDLRVAVIGHAVTNCVTLKSGEQDCPPAGAAYLWIHLTAKDAGNPSALPVHAYFAITLFYRGEPQPDVTLDPGTADMPSWPGCALGCSTQMYAGNALDGWLTFTIPSAPDICHVVVQLDNQMGVPQFTQDWTLAQ